MSLKSSKSSASKVAYMEEEDDEGNLKGQTYATSTAAGSPRMSSAKMNTSRKKSSPRDHHDPPPPNPTDSDSTVHPSRRESRSGRSRRDRERSIPPPQSRRGNMPRPDPPKHSNTAPAIEPASDRRRPPRDQSLYYEEDPRSSSRPRSKTAAPRPHSYYGPPPSQQQPTHPPVANNRYHMMHSGGMAPPPPPASAIPRGGFAPPFAPPPQGPPPQHWQPQPPHASPHGMPHHGPSLSFGGYGMMPPPPMRTPGPPSNHDPFQPQGLPMPPPPEPFGMGYMAPPLEPFGIGSHTPRSEPFGMGGHMPPPHQRDLHQRFARPQTSMGHRPPPPVDYEDREPDRDRYEVDQMANSMRRLSMGYKPRYEEPSRAMSARPSHASPFVPPALPPALPPARERSRHRGIDRGIDRVIDSGMERGMERGYRGQYDDRYEDPENSYYESLVPYDEPPMHRAPRHRRESIEPSQYSYESRPYATEIARTPNNRRNSYYGDANSYSAIDDKLRVASSYQEDKGGGMRLTADLLHEAERDRHGPRSRSTRSSGSRDESDWRQSATTRTTRTSNNEDDLYIRVRNGNVLEMQCQDGTEINIHRPTGRHYSIGEQSVYGEIEDRPSRYDRPALRSRAASRAGSIYAAPENAIEYSYGGGDYSDESPFAPLEVNRYIRD